MPDITMCKGVDCAIKEQCYRYTAKPDVMQSYFVPIVIDKCEWFWDNSDWRKQHYGQN